jgi:hypothetical protein
MIGQSSGVSAYINTDQLTRPPVEKPPVQQEEKKETPQNGRSFADTTELSAKALALAKKAQSTGGTSGQREARGESTRQSPLLPQQSLTSIDIRI